MIGQFIGVSNLNFSEKPISYPEQLATFFDFTDGRVTIVCERHQNHNKANKGTGFEFAEKPNVPQHISGKEFIDKNIRCDKE